MRRLRYSAFAFFFVGSFFGPLAALSLGELAVASVSAVGLLVSAWKLIELNHSERMESRQIRRK